MSCEPKKGICVLGSLNVDLTVGVEHFHLPGETVTGREFHTYTGGKGGNQAVAAAKLGQAVTMVACVGDDENGKMYLARLRELGVNTEYIKTVVGESTGVALIEVDSSGENRIVVVPGANALLDDQAALDAHMAFMGCKVLLLQLETPTESAVCAAELAKLAGATVILDPAPAAPIPERLLRACDYITPNESELAALSGMPAADAQDALKAARKLIASGAKAVINKRGAEGALLVTAKTQNLFFGKKVEVVDTTAAGDTFNAAFATGLAMDYSVGEAICMANAAAALSVTGKGAQSAMPSLMDVIGFV